MLKCGDGTIYTGFTTDVDRRLREHRAGTGAKYTRSRNPVELVRVEHYRTQSKALRREAEIKSLDRHQKLSLIEKK